MGLPRPGSLWRRAAAVLGVLMVAAGAAAILRSEPTGDVDPFGALVGTLGAVIGVAGLVVPVWELRRGRRDAARGRAERAVRRFREATEDLG